MNDLVKLYNEGKALMEQAIDCYSNNKINEAEELRNKANDVYSKAHTLYCLENTDRDKLYGKNRNFGICYHIFEDSLLKNMKNRKGKKFINEVSNLIKKDKVLKEQFDVYNNICKKNVTETNKYIDDIIECVSKMDISKNDIKKSNDKLIDLLEANSNVNKLLDIDNDTLKLYEDIEFILTNKKTINNIDEFNSVKNNLTESLNKIYHHDNSEINEDYEQKISDITEKYEDITNDELKLFEKITSKNTNKSELFDIYKSETIDNVNEAINNASDEDKEQWQNIKTVLDEKKYNEKTFIEDVLNFIEIQKNL